MPPVIAVEIYIVGVAASMVLAPFLVLFAARALRERLTAADHAVTSVLVVLAWPILVPVALLLIVLSWRRR